MPFIQASNNSLTMGSEPWPVGYLLKRQTTHIAGRLPPKEANHARCTMHMVICEKYENQLARFENICVHLNTFKINNVFGQNLPREQNKSNVYFS